MLATEVTGLRSAEAAARLRRDGPNELPAPRAVPWWRRLFGQLFHFFALMLWVSSALAGVARLPQRGVAIVGVVMLNACFAFVQERRADRGADELRDLLPRRVRVIRDGETIE